jgi:hypothetical protein
MCAVHGVDAPCRCGYALFKQTSWAGACVGIALVVLTACGAFGPEPCAPSDTALIVNEASCLAQVKARCAGIPLDEPCPFEEDCKAFTRERCK